MPRIEASDISVHYIGPALEEGRIDLFVLSDGLRGLASLTNRVSQLMFRSDLDFQIELDERFNKGSIVVPLHIFADYATQAESILLSKPAQALATFMTIIGMGSIPTAITVFKLFKRKKGRPLTDEDDLKEILKALKDIEMLLLVKIYNDQEVQNALRRILRPLRVEGIVEFQTRHGELIVDSVTKADIIAADEAEESELLEIEEVVLDIEKAALVPHLAWHLSDEGRSFDARIDDTALWHRIAGGERFGFGDKMRVELRTAFKRDVTGRLTVERWIPKVIEVEHTSPPQRPLWDSIEPPDLPI